MKDRDCRFERNICREDRDRSHRRWSRETQGDRHNSGFGRSSRNRFNSRRRKMSGNCCQFSSHRGGW